MDVQPPPEGQRYSLVYLPATEPKQESDRMRMRLSKTFDRCFGKYDSSAERYKIGIFIEGELGISVTSSGPMSSYLDDRKLFVNSLLRDLLDSITLIFQFFAKSGQSSSASLFLHETRRIFQETGMAFRIDDRGGLHPSIDQAFEATRVSAIRGLEGSNFNAARSAIDDVDSALSENPVDFRRAVRSVFDANENIFKQMFAPKADRLSKHFIDGHLLPLLPNTAIFEPNDVASVTKHLNAFIGWVSAAHDFRHEAGNPDPAPPSEDYAILLISNGLAYARWLGSLHKKMKAAGLL